jgi:predicted nuclease of restriction endonuclease-like (RecB) superfamily
MRKGQRTLPEDRLTAEEEIKTPMVLEFLGLKDEYSESAFEDALIHRLEQFLLELGNDFAFNARQKRLRAGDEWYRCQGRRKTKPDEFVGDGGWQGGSSALSTIIH